MSQTAVVLSEEVREALAARRPVVALESTIIAHGLPRPRNLAVAEELEALVRSGDAVPATIAVLDGVPRIGLDKRQLERVAADDAMRKLGHRDLALAVAAGASGATTVSATAFLAARAGLRVFATGGLGGVHREWTRTQDESADLRLLARTRITVVCAGVKSILDVPATLQRLETLGVGVAGYGTDRFPGFYLASSGEPVDWTLRSPREVAAVMRAADALGGPEAALVVANPVPEDEQLDPALHDRVLAEGLAECRERGITGQSVTPFLLDYLVAHTDGASLEANLAAVRGNVRLAARVAAAWAQVAEGTEGAEGAGEGVGVGEGGGASAAISAGGVTGSGGVAEAL
ncbi:pseudouridine-5'-phosphate glycosidase [Streptomyces sp. enrichment culture]|uniref:pseudouridine-5'-phosphate glycosidase n=1 Tax=Streptomyces sp. enrichment culture TaxID=1795815 RepID=UPI003F56F8BF